MKRIAMAMALMLAGVLTASLPAQNDTSTRSVQGTVTDSANNPASKAVVQLKNTKSLEVLSFITQSDGNYQFHGLNPNVDYEVKAESGSGASGVKRLSSFDTKKVTIINLKLDARK